MLMSELTLIHDFLFIYSKVLSNRSVSCALIIFRGNNLGPVYMEVEDPR